MMTRPTWRPTALLLGLVLALAAPLGRAQDGSIEPAAVPAADGELTVEDLEKRRQAVAGDAGLDEVLKGSIEEVYDEALAALEKRNADLAAMEDYQETVDSAAETIAECRQKTAATTVPEDPAELVSASERALGTEELKALASGLDAELGTVQADVSGLTTRISELKSRSDAIPADTAAARETLREAQAAIAAAGEVEPGSKEEAELLRARARKQAAEAALKKLDLEARTSAQRLRVLQARLECEEARLRQLQARKEAVDAILAERLSETVNAAREMAKNVQELGPQAGELVRNQAEEVEEISADLEEVASLLAGVDGKQERLRERLELLRAEREAVNKQFELGAGRGAFAQMLVQRQAALPKPRNIKRSLDQRQKEITDLRFAAFQVDDKLNRQAKLEEAATKVNEAAREQVRTLLETREKLLVQLEEQYGELIQELGQIDLLERQYLEEVEEFDAVLEEVLFWVPSSPVVSAETFGKIPEDLGWLFSPVRWGELGKAFGRMLSDRTVFFVVLVVTWVVMVLLRPRFRREIAAHRVEIRRISTDRYTYTLRALVLLVLMVLPLPLLLGFIGSQLAADLQAPVRVHVSALWFSQVAWLSFALLFVRELCRKDGLADVHFGWNEKKRLLVRRHISLIAVVYFPALWVIMVSFGEESARMPHSLGRLTFVLAMLWLSGWLAHLFRPRAGLLSAVKPLGPDEKTPKVRVFWFVVLGAVPLVLAGLSLLGYYFTALELTFRLATTVGLLGLAYFLYWLVLRWFVIRERRAALDQLTKARQAKREAAAAAESGDETEAVSGEDGRIAKVEEEAVDLAEVGAQTRRLLRLIMGSLTLVGLWFVWAEAMPVLRHLDSEPLVGSASVADLLLGLLVVAATIVLAKNLPGILEITVLAGMGTDSGARYAIGALVQYAIGLVGFLAAFEVLGMDWSKFGWMAAALSVGLGFGLQEIVANFVSGIILLFERPIRVGDVVTIGETTGVVSRIRIRATTITDWDRKEYVVPNKEFVTGRLLNWTLTNKINRVVLKVGVAYGSDVAKVREVLAEVVGGHPAIMDDPAPLVTFENFGDSSLDFTVRCYLPNLDKRLATIHELNGAIHDRFAKEGIEIPFPQRDLHVRSGWGGAGTDGAGA